MRTLIKILVLFYTLSFSGQNIAIELNEQEGTISTIYHTNSNIVFKISASGNLKAVFIFDSNRAANFYLRNIYLKDLLPANRLQVNDITFRIAQLKTTDYYKEFTIIDRRLKMEWCHKLTTTLLITTILFMLVRPVLKMVSSRK